MREIMGDFSFFFEEVLSKFLGRFMKGFLANYWGNFRDYWTRLLKEFWFIAIGLFCG